METEDFDRRYGIIELDRYYVRSNPAEIAEIFAFIGFVPFHTEYSPMCDMITYQGWCKHFQPVHPACQMPKYVFTVYREEFLGITGVEI